MENYKKNFFWNIIGTTLNSFNSLFFLIIVTRINGVDWAGVFTFGFSMATLFNIIGVYYGRVYQVTDVSENTDMEYIFSKFFTCAIMIIVSVLFLIINHYDLSKSFIILSLCILKCFEAFCEVIYGIFQKRNQLYKVGISLTIKSLICLVSFFVIDILVKNVLISSCVMLAFYIIVMLFYDFRNMKLIKINKVNDLKKVFSLLKKGISPFLVTFLCSFVLNIIKYTIDINLESYHQTIYGIIVMPATVVLLFVQFIIHPFLLDITKYISDNDFSNLFSMIKRFGICIFAFGIVVCCFSWFLGIPVLQLLYNIDLSSYRFDLFLVMIGSVFYGFVFILSYILIAMRHYKAQIIVLLITSFIVFGLTYYLTINLELRGAVLSYIFMMLALSFMYSLIICFSLRKMKKSILLT